MTQFIVKNDKVTYQSQIYLYDIKPLLPDDPIQFFWGVNLPISTMDIVFIGEFAIFRVLTHLVPYLQIKCILVNKLTNMTSKSNNTCRKLRVSAFKRY
jgi:hypothetical protein